MNHLVHFLFLFLLLNSVNFAQFKSSEIKNSRINFSEYFQRYINSTYIRWNAADTNYFQHPLMNAASENDTAILILKNHDIPNGADTLIKGPYYSQNSTNDHMSARIKLRITNNLPESQLSPSDTICVLKMAYRKNKEHDTDQDPEEEYFSVLRPLDTLLLRSNFTNGIGIWQDFIINFVFPPVEKIYEHINFKIEWRGSTEQEIPKYILSIKDILISDSIGRDLHEGNVYIKKHIFEQINAIMEESPTIVPLIIPKR